MTPSHKILTAIGEQSAFPDLHKLRATQIAAKIPGWSGATHYLFFKSVFAALPEIKTVLIIGVYQGRDIAFMSDACERELQIVGVDKFSDTPCDDWPEEKRSGNWQAAGFGDAPTLEKAQANLAHLPVKHALRLIESDDAVWLEAIEGKFDLIFLDTAHDKATVARQLRQVRKLCHENTVIAGDDYENLLPTWGVKDAVTEGFKEHHVLGDVIWLADAGDLK
jgi:hypothetical protein